VAEGANSSTPRIEAFAKTIALGSALLYGVGLIVNALYAARLGIQALTFVNARYILTGAMFTNFAAAPAAAAYLVALLVFRAPARSLKLILAAFGVVVSFTAIGSITAVLAKPELNSPFIGGWRLYLVGNPSVGPPTWTALAMLYILCICLPTLSEFPVRVLARVGAAVLLWVAVTSFATFQQPMIRGAVGGSYWGTASLVVDPATAPPELSSAAAGQAQTITDLFILEDTSDAIYVARESSRDRIFCFPRSRVRSISYKRLPEHN